MLMAYASVAAFFLVAVGFIVGSLVFGRLLRPNNLYAEKLETYECGEAPVGQAWFNFNPRFYIVALIYIVFDVEVAFIYPIAAVFRRWAEQGRGVFALLEVLVFVLILLLGLVYVWAKGDLEWIDRKSTRLNSSHVRISYAVFCLKKKKNIYIRTEDPSSRLTSHNTIPCISRYSKLTKTASAALKHYSTSTSTLHVSLTNTDSIAK